MASVSRRTSKRTGAVSYRVQFRIRGRVLQETFEDPDGAYEFGDLVDKIGGEAARKVLERRRNKLEAMPTLREFTARFLDPASGLLTGIEDGTRRGYERVAALSWLNIIGELPVDAIERADVGRWLAWQEEQPSTRRRGQKVSAKTISNYHVLLSAVFKSAMEQGLRPDNPAFKMRLSKGIAHEAVFLSPDEFWTLLHFIPPYWKPFVRFLAGTGCRWGEATALTWSDFTLWGKPPTFRIEKAWKKGPTGAPVLGHPKSAKARRTVSLTPALVEAIGKPGRGDALVFAGPMSGKHLWQARFHETVWRPAVEKAMNDELCASLGLTVLTRRPRVHDLRHTHASWLIAAGVPLPYIQARLGHEKITTTIDVYGHLVPDAHNIMASAISEQMDGVNTTAAAVDASDDLQAIEALSDIPVFEGEIDPEDDPDSDLYVPRDEEDAVLV